MRGYAAKGAATPRSEEARLRRARGYAGTRCFAGRRTAAPLGIGNPSRNWKSITVTECESDVNIIANQVLEGKAAVKLYAGRRMATGI